MGGATCGQRFPRLLEEGQAEEGDVGGAVDGHDDGRGEARRSQREQLVHDLQTVAGELEERDADRGGQDPIGDDKFGERWEIRGGDESVEARVACESIVGSFLPRQELGPTTTAIPQRRAQLHALHEREVHVSQEGERLEGVQTDGAST